MNGPDTRTLLIGSTDYPAWRAAFARAVMGVGPVPQLPAVMPLWELLDEARETVGTNAVHVPAGRAKTTPKSIVLADLDRMLTLGGNTLTRWARLCIEERASEGITDLAPDDTDEAKCAWMASRLDWVDGKLWADELHTDIRGLHGHLRAICQVRPEYRPRCRKCADTVIPVDGVSGERTTWELSAFGACLGCGQTYPKGPALDVLGQLQEFTLAELAPRVRVAEWTLRDWAKRALLRPVGKVGNARTYRLDDAMRIAERTRTRGSGVG